MGAKWSIWKRLKAFSAPTFPKATPFQFQPEIHISSVSEIIFRSVASYGFFTVAFHWLLTTFRKVYDVFSTPQLTLITVAILNKISILTDISLFRRLFTGTVLLLFE